MKSPSLRSWFFATSVCTALFLTVANTGAFAAESVRPNIVFILADDLGYTDIASYGSEVNTPNLSALAEQGLSFTNYHSAANCAPARAMLLTGVDSHLAGVPNIPEMLAPQQRKHANYQGVLGDDVVTVASLLESEGYHTYMAGKWHLGMAPNKRPSRRGFQRTMAMMDSGADHWEQRPYLALYDQANWFADGERFTLPDNFYSSRFLVDKMIEFIDSNLQNTDLQNADMQNNSPFFAYLPFMAVHSPVQAPQKYIDRYMGVYDSGWDSLREQRKQRAEALGIVPKNTPMVRMKTTDEWDALSEDDKRYQAKRMAVYAGMIEAMDFHIGRLVEFLKARGQYDNTIFIFTSDNGSEASGPDKPRTFPKRLAPENLGYNLDYDNLGLKGSFSSIGPSFASASASPLAYYKFYAGEGGMRVPLIIAGTPVASQLAPAQSLLTRAFAWATDISPTILSLTGVSQPEDRFAGRPIQRITGRDLTPLLSGSAEQIYGPNDAVGYELTGHGVLFQGDYKLVVNQPPRGDGQWRLFNIVTDPGETDDLSASDALRFQRMLSAYEQYLRDNKVVPVPEGYTQIKQVFFNILLLYRDATLVFLLTMLLLLPFYVAYRIKRLP